MWHVVTQQTLPAGHAAEVSVAWWALAKTDEPKTSTCHKGTGLSLQYDLWVKDYIHVQYFSNKTELVNILLNFVIYFVGVKKLGLETIKDG